MSRRWETNEANRAELSIIKVYAYYDAEGQLLYVGQTRDLQAREWGHRRSSMWHAQAVERKVMSRHSTRREAIAAETRAIREFLPLYNLRGNPRWHRFPERAA